MPKITPIIMYCQSDSSNSDGPLSTGSGFGKLYAGAAAADVLKRIKWSYQTVTTSD